MFGGKQKGMEEWMGGWRERAINKDTGKVKEMDEGRECGKIFWGMDG